MCPFLLVSVPPGASSAPRWLRSARHPSRAEGVCGGNARRHRPLQKLRVLQEVRGRGPDEVRTEAMLPGHFWQGGVLCADCQRPARCETIFIRYEFCHHVKNGVDRREAATGSFNAQAAPMQAT